MKQENDSNQETSSSLSLNLKNLQSASFYKGKIFDLLDTATKAYQTTTSNIDFTSIIDDFALFTLNTPSSQTVSEEDIDKINLFLKELFSNECVSVQCLYDIQSKKEDLFFFKYLLEHFCKYNTTSYYILIEKNFDIFAQLINSFLQDLIITQIKDDEITILVLLIKISERTYKETTHKQYLCSQINYHKYFKSIEVWNSLFEKKMEMLIEKEIKGLYKKQQKQKKQSFFTNISNFLSSEMLEESKIVDYYGEYHFENYMNLTLQHKEHLENEFLIIIHQTLKELIEHMCNFNIEIETIFEFVVYNSSNLNLHQDTINFYLFYTHSNILTVKSNISTSLEQSNKIKNIKTNKTAAILSKYPLDMKTQKEKRYVISFISNYLPYSEYVNLFMLNKQISKKIQYNFYLKYLSLVLSNRTKYENYISIHIDVWKIILGISSLNDTFDYEKSKQFAKENIPKEIYTLLELDAKRTKFNENPQTNQQSLVDILATITYVNPSIKYYQGLNYIAAFLLLMTKNEKDAFGLMYSLFINTDFKSLFENELSGIKCNIYIFERLLQLFLPDLGYYLNNHSAKVNLYMIPWMVTLFTNVIQHNDNEVSLITMHIWNEFLICGWKSLFNSLLALLSLHKDKLISYKEDGLLHFLINDLVKTQKIRNDSYEEWLQEKKKFNIRKRTLRNLKEEFNYENNFNK